MLHERKRRYFDRPRLDSVEVTKAPQPQVAGANGRPDNEKEAAKPQESAMKTRIVSILGLVALASAVVICRGVPTAEATPGQGATKFDLKTSVYPNQCATIKQTRQGVSATAASNLPATPLANRNIVTVCISPESLTELDAGSYGEEVKIRNDNGIPAIGTFQTDGGAAPGMPLFIGTLIPSIMNPVPCATFNSQTYVDGGGNIQGVANFNLVDAGTMVFVDITECAY